LSDKGKHIDTIYLHFQKEFDKVPHKRLLTELTQTDPRDATPSRPIARRRAVHKATWTLSVIN